MAHPEFTVLLARQRSGTNALLSVLGTHPDIFCFDEVFRRDDLIRPDDAQIRGNYFNFVAVYAAGDPAKVFPDRHEHVLAEYVAHLYAIAQRRHVVVDVKYNSTHHLSGVWRPLIGEPGLFGFLKARGAAVLHLTRRNYLRCLLSHLKAWESRRYYVFEGPAPADVRVSVPAAWALDEMTRWEAEDTLVAHAFHEYPLYKQIEYADLFPDASGAMAMPALEDLRQWFGVSDAFINRASLSKQSSLPLNETVENMDELVKALRGTPFEYCLEDEPAYR
jgi:hypothetical protein